MRRTGYERRSGRTRGRERERVCRRSGAVERAESSRGGGVDSRGGWHYPSERRTAIRRRVDLHQRLSAEMLLHVLPQAQLQHKREPHRRPPHVVPTMPGQHQDAPHELARGHEEEAQAEGGRGDEAGEGRN